jgi:hypothetical protein
VWCRAFWAMKRYYIDKVMLFFKWHDFSAPNTASYGSYLLGALGLGLLCYGIFNFIRAFYEKLA